MHPALLALAMTGVAGCAATPELPSFALKPGDKVGILVALDSTPVHSHVGTTVFNNFSKPYPEFKWPFDATGAKALQQALAQRAGLQVVDLEAAGWTPEQLQDLASGKRGAWAVNPLRQAEFERLKREGFVAVVVLRSRQRHMVAQECTQFGCAARFAEGAGLYTRSFLGMDRYFAVPAIDARAYLLDPVGDLTTSDSLRSQTKFEKLGVELEQDDPKNFDRLTEADWAPAKKAVEASLMAAIDAVVLALVPAGLTVSTDAAVARPAPEEQHAAAFSSQVPATPVEGSASGAPPVAEAIGAPAVTAAGPVPATFARGQRAVARAATHIRARADASAPSMAPIDGGMPIVLKLPLQTASGRWWYVETSGASGWIAEQELQPVAP